ncbi:MAG: MFS transporter [Clostridia bacterium]|nr:MFS transporter [Clostridia bacterium]
MSKISKAAEAVQKSATSGATYTRRELAGYLTGLAGQNIIYNIIASGLAFYFQSVIFIPVAAYTAIFAIARVWDAVNDPMMGTIVDKTRTKWGKCKPYLLFVPAVILVTTILPFINSMYAEPIDKYYVQFAEDTSVVAAYDDALVHEEFVYDDEDNAELDGTYVLVPVKNLGKLDKDENGNFLIDDSGNMVKNSWELDKDENGNFLIDDSGNMVRNSWELDKNENGNFLIDESGNMVKNDAVIFKVTDNGYEKVTDKSVGMTLVQRFQEEKGIVKKTGAKAVLIIAWAAISYILWGMTYTIGDIPLWGVTSLMTESQQDRAKALSLARAVANVGMIGTLFTMIAPSFNGIYMNRGMDQAHALRFSYITLAVVMTLFASILFQFAGIAVKERVSPQNEKTYTIRENLKIMFGNKPFRQILISGILRSPIQLLGIVAMTLIMYYFFNNDIGATLDAEGFTLIGKILVLVVGLFGGMIFFPLFVPKLITRIEKKTLYNFFTLIGAIPFALIFVLFLVFKGNVLSWPGMVIMSVLFFMGGASMGSLNVLQSVMIADCVDYEEYTNGTRPDGVFFSGQSFITKLSAGIATLISGAVYGFVGFSDSKITLLNNALIAGENFKTYNPFTVGGADVGKFAAAMFFLISIPPAIGMVLAAIPTLRYALTDKEHTRILDELIARRAAGAAAEENGADAE